MHGFVSYRFLRKHGRYVATEPCMCSVATSSVQHGNSIVASFRAAECEIPTELQAQKGLKVKNPQGPKKRPKGPRHRGPAKSLKDRRFPGNSAPKVHELLDDLKISGSSGPGPIWDFEKFISRYSGSQSQGQCDILAQTTLKNQRQELLKEPRVIWSRRSEPITRPRDLKDSKFKRPREEG
ncbi:hypothetical protein DY000_02060883 [Brassica cretica]|uniref:Uncharacterized protein n=1 Tax=Brassica cretica TaxID=69181 RepID=A0ABQ7AVE4_BRACR|nr:hypothetical protein DY000_02060883 [Brassica cretica]